MDAQQVVEGGDGINECCAGGITVLYWWLSVFLEVMQQGLPGFAEVESPKENMPHKEHGESLKSRNVLLILTFC